MEFKGCVLECCLNECLVKEFNRLSGCNLSFRDARVPIEKMIDEATGYNNPFKNKPEEMRQFLSFCFKFVWLPLISTALRMQSDKLIR